MERQAMHDQMNRRGFLKGAVWTGALATVGGAFGESALSGKGSLKELGPVVTDWEFRRAKNLSGRKAAMYIDDVIWVFRDLTRQRPKSMFGNPFLGALKDAHERYGLKVQLNCFYRTDIFYGMDEFSLADMTDAYKGEWQASKDWLRLGFHSYQEFPDYPFINSSYNDVATAFDRVFGEVKRFAGEGVFTCALVGHWLPFSKDGCRALKDRGVKLVACTDGTRYAYAGDRDSLPYGHAFRVESNRKPETALFRREAYDAALLSSACGYNHLCPGQVEETWGSFAYVYDRDVGIGFKRFRSGPMLNLCTPEKVREEMAASERYGLLAFADHEQYFYKDYYAYQPDYVEKIFLAAKMANAAGREFVFMEDTAV
ncbi:MAG: hypothetical protein IKF72_11930 [Kiritimatiellae bacterium]|nr:hypothetical protein [Kiritimatiellia bacterium]